MKICIIGAFDFSGGDTGGQPVKTRELHRALCDRYGADSVSIVETYRWKSNPLRMLKGLPNIGRADVVILLPAMKGIKVFSQLALWLKKKKARVFYDVVGGWLPKLAAEDAALCNRLKRFDGLWVETTSMQQDLSALGITKVTVVPNFKYLDILPREQLCNEYGAPYRLCTFSRVMAEKGITDAVQAVAAVNHSLGRQVYTLDIYGPVAPDYEAEFNALLAEAQGTVCYKGVASPEQSVEILKDYFALLFPTYYHGEGLAGTLIDALSAGLPTIASDWRYNKEVIDDTTGLLFKPRDVEQLKQVLVDIAAEPSIITDKKSACIKAAERYQPHKVMEQISALIENK